jgi:2-aminobenzoylacetyl-CoA thioesterase
MLIETPPARIADGLWMLGTHEYPVYLVVEDGEAMLVEGGSGPMGPLVCEQMDALVVRPERVGRIVILHAHPDHVMGVPALRAAMPGAKVLASAAAARMLSVEKAVAYFAEIDAAITAALIEGGLVGEAHRPPPLETPQIPVDGTLAEGDVLSAGRFRFEVLETPGHSDCSLSLFEPAGKILFSSDAAGYHMRDFDYWWPNYFGDYRTYLDSIARLAGLGAETLCQGHHGAIVGAEDVRAFLDEAVRETEAYHRRILAELDAGKGVRPLAEELGAEVYEKSRILPLDFFQKNCNVLVKQSMRQAGK